MNSKSLNTNRLNYLNSLTGLAVSLVVISVFVLIALVGQQPRDVSVSSYAIKLITPESTNFSPGAKLDLSLAVSGNSKLASLGKCTVLVSYKDERALDQDNVPLEFNNFRIGDQAPEVTYPAVGVTEFNATYPQISLVDIRENQDLEVKFTVQFNPALVKGDEVVIDGISCTGGGFYTSDNVIEEQVDFASEQSVTFTIVGEPPALVARVPQVVRPSSDFNLTLLVTNNTLNDLNLTECSLAYGYSDQRKFDRSTTPIEFRGEVIVQSNGVRLGTGQVSTSDDAKVEIKFGDNGVNINTTQQVSVLVPITQKSVVSGDELRFSQLKCNLQSGSLVYALTGENVTVKIVSTNVPATTTSVSTAVSSTVSSLPVSSASSVSSSRSLSSQPSSTTTSATEGYVLNPGLVVSIPSLFYPQGSRTTRLEFLPISDLVALNDFVIDLPLYGQVSFLSSVNLGTLNFANKAAELHKYIQIATGVVSIDTNQLPELDRPAIITMRRVAINPNNQIIVLRDGTPAGDSVSNVFYDAEKLTLTFRVEGFSRYTIDNSKPYPATTSFPVALAIGGLVGGAAMFGGVAYALDMRRKRKLASQQQDIWSQAEITN